MLSGFWLIIFLKTAISIASLLPVSIATAEAVVPAIFFHAGYPAANTITFL